MALIRPAVPLLNILAWKVKFEHVVPGVFQHSVAQISLLAALSDLLPDWLTR